MRTQKIILIMIIIIHDNTEHHTYYDNYNNVFSIAALHLVGTMMLGIQRDPSAKSLVISVLHCKLKDEMLHLHDKLQGINLNVIL